MPLNPRHLVTGENPPSSLAQLLANTLPPWTANRTYGLPSGPLSLTAQTANTYSRALHGSHYQRFINAFALELEILADLADTVELGNFLEYPGYTYRGLDMVWEASPAQLAPVSACVGNLTAKRIGAPLPNGTYALDPHRTFDITLASVSRLYDFYYGLSLQESFAGAGSFRLSHRVATEADGTQRIEWVSVNGTEVTDWTLASDGVTINVPEAGGGKTTVVHYTTYDIYYQLPDYSKVYARAPFYELQLTINGQLVLVTPTLSMVWNALDEIGLYFSKPRQSGETNAQYQRRLIDTILFPSDPTLTGLRNALATELGLVHHVLWGPQAVAVPGLPSITATASSIAIGSGSVDADAIMIDRLPLAYYSVATTAGQHDTVTLALPAIAAGARQSVTLQLVANGTVVPTAVPLTVTTTLPQNQLGVYDQIGDASNPITRPKTLFSAPSRPWLTGSLQVYKNGTALARGTDFTELSSTVFSLATPAMPGDLLQLGYIFEGSDGPPDLEAQADIDTDLQALVRVGFTVSVDPVLGTSPFAPWQGVPPGVDPAAVPTSGTWTITFTATNIGSASSSAGEILVTLPPQISWDGQHLTIARSDVTHDVRYIDDAELWVHNLTDAAIAPLLYNIDGSGTPLLKALAAEINQRSPLEFGAVSWDRTIWHTLTERYSSYGFVPQQLDPPYQEKLTPQTMLYAGALTGTGDAVDPATAGRAIVGQSILGAGSSPFTVAIAPGNAVGASGTVRYPDFQSGIGFGEDLLASFASAEVLAAAAAATPPAQRPLSRVNAAELFTVLPASGADMWLVTMNPGTYYLNQEEHYLFSTPIYAETTAPLLFLEARQPNTQVLAYRYDPSAGLVPLRRVNFLDANGNPTLQFTETLTPVNNTIALTFTNVSNVTVLSAVDGNSYTPVATTGNLVSFTSCDVALTVQYTLVDSFCVVDTDGGSYFFMDAVQPNGALVMYEGGTGPNVTTLPLHPYYNPRTQGFLYLSADLYLPTTIQVWVDPSTVPADGSTTFNTKVFVSDDYGAGIAGLPVNILVDYREGALALTATTDAFGYVSADLPAQSSVQVAKVTASVQLTDASGTPLPALLASTFVELFNPYS